MKKYILAIDQGTTGTTALLFDKALNIHGKSTVEFTQHFPKPSWVEHDLDAIWASVVRAVKECLFQKNIQYHEIAAIGITNQRETTCLWHKDKDAHPVYRAIVWQDRRTSAECDKLKKRGLEKKIHQKTGLLLDPYFSATKIQWLLKNVTGAAALAKKGAICFGTVDSYLLYRMTGGTHRTDVTNASRTMLMDIKKLRWDEDMLKLFGVPKTILPEILPNATEFGVTQNFLSFPDGTPITAMAGDQQAALFGQACFDKGNTKCTYGTGAFVLVNTGEKPIFSKNKLLTTVAWKIGKKPTYCVEGSAFIAGAAVQWLRDGLRLFESSPQVENLAATVQDSDGVTFVPALSGMGAPHWMSNATGMLTGITRRTTRAHVARATLEGIALQVRELCEAMSKDCGKKLTTMKVDGGASANSILMQFQADLLGMEVVRSKVVETTALGVGFQAGLAIGFWKDMNEIKRTWAAAEKFKPRMPADERKWRIDNWTNAVQAVRLLADWAKKRPSPKGKKTIEMDSSSDWQPAPGERLVAKPD